MYILSTFEHSSYLELAIRTLEHQGIKRENILAVPLDNRQEEPHLFDSVHRSDGVSLFDKGAAIATAFAVIGTSMGFVLEWGPIYWGLIFAVTGFFIGFSIDLYIHKGLRKKQRLLRGKHAEVVLIITCQQEQVNMIKQILWKYLAIGVAHYDG